MNELSAEYIKAQSLDRKIKTSAQLAQQNLYDMCMGFKEMRDSKLYKELGYSDFGDYCEKETGFTPRSVYRYISIAENLPSDFVTPVSQIGVRKLYLLSTLSEDERTELTENTDLENTTVRQLEDEIKKLKIDKDKSEIKLDEINQENIRISKQKNDLSERIVELESQIKELESRPVEVAVTDNSAEENRLKEVIKSLERENIKQNEALEESYRKQEQDVRRMLEREKQEELDKLNAELSRTRAEYEKKLSEQQSQTSQPDDKEIFKAYLANAVDAVQRLCGFITSNSQSANYNLFCDKAKQLVGVINSKLGE